MKAGIEETMRKIFEFERKVLRIVEKLSEENITEEFLRACGKLSHLLTTTVSRMSDLLSSSVTRSQALYPNRNTKFPLKPIKSMLLLKDSAFQQFLL